jgi:acyl carrier protein phosphodiesterase
VISISKDARISEEIADLAYDYWLARRFRTGSPERDFLQAVIAVTYSHTANQPERPSRLSPARELVSPAPALREVSARIRRFL